MFVHSTHWKYVKEKHTCTYLTEIGLLAVVQDKAKKLCRKLKTVNLWRINIYQYFHGTVLRLNGL